MVTPLAITLLGTGLMGSPMACRLVQAGHRVTVWNRSPDKTKAAAALGARVAVSPADAVKEAQVVITMLSNGPAVTEILEQGGVLAAMPADALFIDMSSIPPDTARRHAALCEARGLEVLDAPVSGGVVGAEAGTLAIMVGGSEAAFAQAQAVFSVLGRATRVGPAGCGALAKLANQMIVGITIGAVAEALILSEAGGANPEAVRAAIRGGFAESRVLEVHGERMLKHSYVPGAKVSIQLKDLNSALDAAREAGIELPILERVRELFDHQSQAGFADLDHSGLHDWIRRLNHLQ
jgi:2-hydroxy-3-oxopropionate reductase